MTGKNSEQESTRFTTGHAASGGPWSVADDAIRWQKQLRAHFQNATGSVAVRISFQANQVMLRTFSNAMLDASGGSPSNFSASSMRPASISSTDLHRSASWSPGDSFKTAGISACRRVSQQWRLAVAASSGSRGLGAWMLAQRPVGCASG